MGIIDQEEDKNQSYGGQAKDYLGIQNLNLSKSATYDTKAVVDIEAQPVEDDYFAFQTEDKLKLGSNQLPLTGDEMSVR